MCVKRWETTTSVLAREVATLLDRVVPLAEITQSMANDQTGDQIDLTAVCEEDWDAAVERYQAINPLVESPGRTLARVTEVADALAVSAATVYRWLARVSRYGTVSCLLRKQRSDKGSKRLAEPVEAIVSTVIAGEYLTDQRRSPTAALREIERLCRQRKLIAPSKGTLLRRIDEILPEEKVRKRHGRNASLDVRATRGTLPGVDHVHAIWQIDHTKVDIMLVDEKDRIPIGRPWITVAIDVFTRMVVGWYISFDPPGTLATGICIATAILPKDTPLARLGADYPWPCQGKPRLIHTDNAKEFRGETLRNACQEHGINMSFRKLKKPNYGAHIERLLGTLLKEIHSLEGTTFSNPQERGEYKSEERATMTLDEFELWLANLILRVYHQRKHSELGCAPIKKYQEGLLGDGSVPGIGVLPIAADPEKLRMDLLPMEERTIQPYGVVLDHIQYHAPVLDKWIGALDPKTRKKARKFVFRRDPRNISQLYFWDPDARQYYQIPYRDIRRPAISLWELKRIQGYLNDRGKADIDEEMIFNAFDEMKKIEETSKTLTRAQRMNQERRRRHGRAVPSPAPSTAEEARPLPTGKTFDPSAIKPFDEIEQA
jgi:putative transposase